MLSDWFERLRQLGLGEARRDVLRAIQAGAGPRARPWLLARRREAPRQIGVVLQLSQFRVRRAGLKPVDCTTNSTIVLKAVDTPEYRDVVDEVLGWGQGQSGDATRLAPATACRLAVSVGAEILRLVPGYVSTEVDGKLSFNIAASVARPTRSSTPTNREESGPGACSSNSHRREKEASVAERPIALPPHEQGESS